MLDLVVYTSDHSDKWDFPNQPLSSMPLNGII